MMIGAHCAHGAAFGRGCNAQEDGAQHQEDQQQRGSARRSRVPPPDSRPRRVILLTLATTKARATQSTWPRRWSRPAPRVPPSRPTTRCAGRHVLATYIEAATQMPVSTSSEVTPLCRFRHAAYGLRAAAQAPLGLEDRQQNDVGCVETGEHQAGRKAPLYMSPRCGPSGRQ